MLHILELTLQSVPFLLIRSLVEILFLYPLSISLFWHLLGNRVAAITWGPEHVILIVSLNKVCQDVDAAIKRARSTAAPINMARFDLPKTPCKVDGLCHDCLSADSICNYVSIQRMSHPAHRHIVLLTNEILGY